MKQQSLPFNYIINKDGGVTNVYNGKNKESRDPIINTRVEPSHLKTLKEFCCDNELILSNVLSEASILYMNLFPFIKKLKNKGTGELEKAIAWLNELP